MTAAHALRPGTILLGLDGLQALINALGPRL